MSTGTVGNCPACQQGHILYREHVLPEGTGRQGYCTKCDIQYPIIIPPYSLAESWLPYPHLEFYATAAVPAGTDYWSEKPIAPPVAVGSVDAEKLRKLAQAATRGEWRHTRQGVIVAGPFRQYTNGSAQSQIASFCVTSHEEDDEHQTEKQVPNALFAAAACPDVVLALIERAEKAEARVKELEAGRQALQAEGTHPAPCARHCEANAFQIEVRRLELDLECVKRERWEQAYEIQALKARIESTPPFVPMGGKYAIKA